MRKLPAPIGSVLDDSVEEARVERLVQGIFHPRRTSPRLAAFVFCASVAAGVLFLWPSPPKPLGLLALPKVMAAPENSGTTLYLSDGSSLELWPGTTLRVLRSDASAVDFDLLEGRARFDVRPQRSRTWAIRLGREVVEVVGTRFVVAREGGRTEVNVEEGQVRLLGAQGSKALSAGMSHHVSLPKETRVASASATAPKLVFERSPAPGAPARPVHKTALNKAAVNKTARPKEREVVQRQRPSGGATSIKAPVARPNPERPADKREVAHEEAPDWRAPAERGQYARAYELLTRPGLLGLAETSDARTLFLAADVARGAGDPDSAARLLKALLRRFPTSSIAGLAATHRARILLEDLDRAHEAALAYEQALSLRLSTSLTESAMVGRLRAWIRAGDHDRARRAAHDYRRAFPKGRWRALVDRWAR